MSEARDNPTPAAPPGTLSTWWLLAGIALLTVLAYLPAMRGPFVWDGAAITQNSLLRSTQGLADIWLRPSLNENEAHYWPVTYTVLWAGWQLWDSNTLGYHLLNLSLHLANSTLVWLILRRLRIPGALLAAALFAVHPVHVEAVAWIIQTKELLATLFALAATWVYLRAGSLGGTETTTTRSPAAAWIVLCILAYLLAVLSKSSALPLPVCLALVCWWRRRGWHAGYAIVAAMLVLGLAVGTADILFSRREALPQPIPFTHRISIALQALWFYAGRLIAPVQVLPIFPPRQVSGVLATLSAIALVVVVGAIVRFRRYPVAKGAAVALVSYLAFLAPTLGLIPFGFHKFTNVADRFQYLASIAGTALMATGIVTMARRLLRPRLHLPMATAILILFASQSTRQARLWSDDTLFWESAAEVLPQNDEVANNLGVALDRARRYPEAEQAYRRAIAIAPSNARLHLNLAAALMRQNHHAEAEPALQQALRLRPNLPEAHNNFGLILQQRGDTSAALAAYRAAVQQSPAYSNARLNLAVLLFNLGQRDAAMAELRTLLTHDPTHPQARQIAQRVGLQ